MTISRNPRQSSARTEAAEETVWRGNVSQLTNVKWILFAVFFYWLLVPVVLAMWKLLHLYFHQYTLTTERLIESQGIGKRQTDQLELSRVQDVRHSATLLQWLFGKGDVILVTTDRTHPELCLHWVADPEWLATQVRNHAKRSKLEDPYTEINVN